MLQSRTDGWFWLVRMLSRSIPWARWQPRRWRRYCDCDLVDGDLGPQQDPVLVGELLDLGVERIVGANDRRPELARPPTSASSWAG